MKELELQACVYSRTAPEEAQLAQLRAFLNQKYRRPVRLRWERDERMKDGFRLELGEGESRELVYDWSSAGKSRQLKDRIAAAIRSRSDVIPLLEKTLREHDALAYTIVLCSSASDSAPLQYIAPSLVLLFLPMCFCILLLRAGSYIIISLKVRNS